MCVKRYRWTAWELLGTFVVDLRLFVILIMGSIKRNTINMI